MCVIAYAFSAKMKDKNKQNVRICRLGYLSVSDLEAIKNLIDGLVNGKGRQKLREGQRSHSKI